MTTLLRDDRDWCYLVADSNVEHDALVAVVLLPVRLPEPVATGRRLEQLPWEVLVHLWAKYLFQQCTSLLVPARDDISKMCTRS